MKKLVILMLAMAASLAAADFSGIWNGTGGMASTKYGSVPYTGQMTLLQAGNSLQGTFKIGNGKPMAITNGSVSGNTFTFAMGGGSGVATFTLNGSQLTGSMTSSSGQVVTFVFTKQ